MLDLIMSTTVRPMCNKNTSKKSITMAFGSINPDVIAELVILRSICSIEQLRQLGSLLQIILRRT